MNTERRILLASILSAMVLVISSTMIPKPPARRADFLTPTEQKAAPAASLTPPAVDDEETFSIESQTLKVALGKNSAAIREVLLREFKRDPAGDERLRFGQQSAVLLLRRDAMSPLVLVEEANRRAAWRSQDGLHEVTIELDRSLPVLYISERGPTAVPLIASWARGDTASGRNNMLEAFLRTEKDLPWQRRYLHYIEGSSAKIVPRGTAQITLSERFFCLSLKPKSSLEVSILPVGRGQIAVSLISNNAELQGGAREYRVYVGPRDFFKLREAGFEQAFPLGILANIGLALMFFLKGIASIVRNYGIAIILFSVLITVALSPFTLMSYRSMKKMQELQPKLDQIKTKYKDEPQKANQAMMALFRENRVSPLSGCLPMFLQLPIFFALWSAISHVIELRGERFLWIRDLSMPDRLARLPFGELNILPILMTAAMYFQSKMTQKNMAATAKSQAMLSGPMMSLIFGLMFYQVPSSLVLYWLTNNIVSIISMRVARI